MQVTAERPNDLLQQREELYAALEKQNISCLWRAKGAAQPKAPRVESVPHIWRWRDIRPALALAGDLVTAQEAERRVLMLINPGYTTSTLRTVGLMFSGIQMIRPGETADRHRHAPNAQRFIIEGEGAFSTVDGERALMSKGDFVLTPSWSWHDHGNESDRDVIWLDGLDVAFINMLDANFFEEPDGTSAPAAPTGDSHSRWGRNMRPAWQGMDRLSGTALISYPWRAARDTLHALRFDEGSPFDGIVMQYVDPRTGGPTLPTIASSLQLLRKGEHTRRHRHTSSAVYHVAEGGGRTLVDGKEIVWEEGDTFVVPSWSWHEHESTGGEAVLFTYSDRPIIDKFNWYREEAETDAAGTH